MQTILKILFKKNEKVDKTASIDIISGFDESRPFIRKLIAAIENENSTSLTFDELTRLSEKIEKNVYKLTPISAFLTDVGLYIDYEISIPNDHHTLFRPEILYEMLTKRGIDTILKTIQSEEDRDFWTITDIENVFFISVIRFNYHILIFDLNYLSPHLHFTTHNSHLTTHNSQLTTHNSQLTTHNSNA